MKTLVLTILLLNILACTEHVHPEPEVISIPKDYCDGDEIRQYMGTFTYDGNILSYPYTTEQCEFGCAEDSETAWCKSPCDDVVCKEPEIKKACESSVFLVEYRSECVETAEAPHYECISVVATRRYCGCYDDPTPHCYGE